MYIAEIKQFCSKADAAASWVGQVCPAGLSLGYTTIIGYARL